MNIPPLHPGMGLACAAAALTVGPALAGCTAALPARGVTVLPARWWACARPSRTAAMGAAAALLAGLVGTRLGATPLLPAWWLLAVLGVGLAVADIEHRRLPNRLLGVLAAGGIATVAAAALLLDSTDRAVRALCGSGRHCYGGPADPNTEAAVLR
jgi:leader peptidase (prepilin peptidase)/N-methyltransferase